MLVTLIEAFDAFLTNTSFHLFFNWYQSAQIVRDIRAKAPAWVVVMRAAGIVPAAEWAKFFVDVHDGQKTSGNE